MTKWCIDWDAAQYFIELYRMKEKEWKKSCTPKYFDAHGLEHALRILFEHKGFWIEEEKQNG